MATYLSKKLLAAFFLLCNLVLVGCGTSEGSDDGGSDSGADGAKKYGASYPFAYPVGTATGDLGGSFPAPTVTGLQGHAVPGPTGTATNLQWSGSALSWAAGGGGSFTAANDLSGTSSSQTVVGLQSRALLSTAPSTGNAIVWDGLEWAPSPMNLAGGAASITGTLPAANQAAQAMGGDGSGTTGALVVNKVSGASAISISQPAFTWTLGAGAPTLSQATAASGVNPTNFIIASQAPNAGSTTLLTNTPGSVFFNVAVPGASGTAGTEAGFGGQRNGTNFALFVPRVGAATTNAYAYIGPNANAPSGTNYLIQATSSDIYLNAASLATHIQSGASDIVVINGTTTQIGANGNAHSMALFGTAAYGGGAGVVSFHNAGTVPTTNPSTAGIEYASGGAGNWRGSGGATTNFACTGTGTKNTQTGLVDLFESVVSTTASATPTAFPGVYTTLANTGGFLTCRLVTKATTTGTGIAVNDTAAGSYVLGYKNTSGTVTLSTAGLTALAAVQTTAAAQTTALTAAAATNTIVFSVTNVSLNNDDSQVSCQVDVN